VLINLIGNAIKFTQEGSVTLTVATGQKTNTHLTLQLTVSDTGIGIPQDRQKAIFDAFSQADASTTRQFGGTGLGLAISRRLVEMMNGRIWVKSEEGKGSHFHFIAELALPQTEPSPGEEPEQAEKGLELSHSGLRVLLVEDNPVNQLLARRILEKLDCDVVIAENGQAAIDAHQNETFDLILMDGQMPGMDGFEATTIIRAREKETGTYSPIIALTAHAMEGDRQRFLDAGMDDYLSKPFTPGQLVDVINKMLRNGEA